MRKDKFFKAMLVIIAVLLFLNLFSQQISSLILPKAVAQGNAQVLNFGVVRGGAGIACSTNGKYVYAVDTKGIYRSTDYGSPGSWQQAVD